MKRSDVIEMNILAFLLGATLACLIWIMFSPYKTGTIDALTGHPKYHLVIHPDSTRTWEEIGK